MANYCAVGDTVVYHPGYYVQDELNYSGGDSDYSRNRLADKLDISRIVLDGLINGEVDVDVNLAIQMHEAFGPSAQYYLNLQQEYNNKTGKSDR